MTVVEFYCLKGKHKIKIADPKQSKWPNGRAVYVAECPEHHIKVNRLMPSANQKMKKGGSRKSRSRKSSRRSRSHSRHSRK